MVETSEYKGRGRITKEIYEIIKRAKKPVSIQDIRESTNINYNTIRGTVQRLAKQGLIKRVSRGIYKWQS